MLMLLKGKVLDVERMGQSDFAMVAVLTVVAGKHDLVKAGIALSKAPKVGTEVEYVVRVSVRQGSLSCFVVNG